MDSFFPFIHKIKKKKEDELRPLYVEIYPPPKEKEDKKESKIIVIEL